MQSDCVLWQGKRKTFDGYGMAFVNGKYIRAHRLAYAQAHGMAIDEIANKVIMHKCDTPACVNPAHLEIGTRGENNRDRAAKDRSAKGSRNGKARLSESDVVEIKRLLSAGSGRAQIARMFGVSYSAVKSIAIGRCWSHVVLAN